MSTISPGAETFDLAGPGDGFEPGTDASTIDVNFPKLLIIAIDPFGVDIDDDALAAEAAGSLTNEIGILRRGAIDRDLVGTGAEQVANVVERADAAADGQWHKDLLGSVADDVEHDGAIFVTGGDIEKDEFVGAFFFISLRHLYRVAGVAEVDEIRPFDDATAVDVEAWYHAAGEHKTYRRVESIGSRSRGWANRRLGHLGHRESRSERAIRLNLAPETALRTQTLTLRCRRLRVNGAAPCRAACFSARNQGVCAAPGSVQKPPI